MARDALRSPRVGVTWIELPPGRATQGEKGHYHDEQDEVYVLVCGGPLAIRIEDVHLALSPGEAVRVDAGVVHALRNAGTQPATVIAVSGQLPRGGDDSHPVDGFWQGDESPA
jgi:mannose-6-phosphate isomerase-like protein (cupin superfamily)